MADRLDDPLLYDYVRMQLAYHRLRTTVLFDPPIQKKSRAVIEALGPILALLKGDIQTIIQESDRLSSYLEQVPGWEDYVEEIPNVP